MVTQSKTFVDAARKASIKHLVHLAPIMQRFYGNAVHASAPA
jgi:hypothetical protein